MQSSDSVECLMCGTTRTSVTDPDIGSIQPRGFVEYITLTFNLEDIHSILPSDYSAYKR